MSKGKKKPPAKKEPPVVEKPFDDIVGALLRVVPTKKRPKSSKKVSRSKR